MSERPLATVGGLIIAPDGEILLVRSKKWSNLYSVPGGKVEWGETREEAFRREVLEETGLLLDRVEFAFVQDCIFSPEFWKKGHFVMNDFIGYLHEESSKKQIRLNDEAYEWIWTSPGNALTLPLHRECRQLIEWYQVHYLKGNKRLATIGIQHHAINCLIGVLPHEREITQTIYVDVKVKANIELARQSDHIENTINYVLISRVCTELAQHKHYHLIESFAYDVVHDLLKQLEIEWAWICVKKPSAIETAHYTFVEYECSKN